MAAGGRPPPSGDGVAARQRARIASAGASLQADIVEHALVLAPFRFHPDVQVEKDLGVEKLFQVFARRDADPLDHLAAAADDDGLLRLALDDDRAVEVERAVLPLR